MLIHLKNLENGVWHLVSRARMSAVLTVAASMGKYDNPSLSLKVSHNLTSVGRREFFKQRKGQLRV